MEKIPYLHLLLKNPKVSPRAPHCTWPQQTGRGSGALSRGVRAAHIQAPSACTVLFAWPASAFRDPEDMGADAPCTSPSEPSEGTHLILAARWEAASEEGQSPRVCVRLHMGTPSLLSAPPTAVPSCCQLSPSV